MAKNTTPTPKRGGGPAPKPDNKQQPPRKKGGKKGDGEAPKKKKEGYKGGEHANKGPKWKAPPGANSANKRLLREIRGDRTDLERATHGPYNRTCRSSWPGTAEFGRKLNLLNGQWEERQMGDVKALKEAMRASRNFAAHVLVYSTEGVEATEETSD